MLAHELQEFHLAVISVCPIAGLDAEGNVHFDPANPPTEAQQKAAEKVIVQWLSDYKHT